MECRAKLFLLFAVLITVQCKSIYNDLSSSESSEETFKSSMPPKSLKDKDQETEPFVEGPVVAESIIPGSPVNNIGYGDGTIGDGGYVNQGIGPGAIEQIHGVPMYTHVWPQGGYSREFGIPARVAGGPMHGEGGIENGAVSGNIGGIKGIGGAGEGNKLSLFGGQGGGLSGMISSLKGGQWGMYFGNILMKAIGTLVHGVQEALASKLTAGGA